MYQIVEKMNLNMLDFHNKCIKVLSTCQNLVNMQRHATRACLFDIYMYIHVADRDICRPSLNYNREL